MPHASDLRLVVLHGVRLKGFATPDAVASAHDLDPPSVERALTRLAADELVMHRNGRLSGWMLTPDGRREHARLLHEELERVGCREQVVDAYDRFLELNPEALELCTAWQMRDVAGRSVPNDHADPAYDRDVVGRLISLHDRARPVVAELRGHLRRFRPYSARLRHSVQRVVDGHHDWFTRPLIDSYHTVWFELHEDLLVTLGIERAKEAQP